MGLTENQLLKRLIDSEKIVAINSGRLMDHERRIMALEMKLGIKPGN